jgi:beta-phosphoglucomutase-like phosphatase (HAD superfamily)
MGATDKERQGRRGHERYKERASGAAADSKHAITRDRTVEHINQLRDQGFKVAVVTSSQNCTAVLKAAKRITASTYKSIAGSMLNTNPANPPRTLT